MSNVDSPVSHEIRHEFRQAANHLRLPGVRFNVLVRVLGDERIHFEQVEHVLDMRCTR